MQGTPPRARTDARPSRPPCTTTCTSSSSRYYEDGDFISKRRYGRNQRYAIPYNGEEVYLHWANSDQYYIKTDEHFRDYDWTAPSGVSVRFRITGADVEQNNVKGDKRFFLPRAAETRWDADERAVTVPFEYRPLTGAESRKYGNRNQQDKINTEAASAIPQGLNAPADALESLTGPHPPDDRRLGDPPSNTTCGATPARTTPTSSSTRTCPASLPASWTST